MAETDLATGGRFRDRVGTRNPAPIFAVLGVGLLVAAYAVPAFEALLVAWGGTALFVALLLRFVMGGPTLSARVTTDIYETMARNARRQWGPDRVRYVPDDGGTLLARGDELDPVGKRLLATVEGETGETLSDHLSVLVDVLVNDLELAGRVQATTTDDGATVTVTDSRVGTGELFDHPVSSVLGVGLARRLGTPVGVESTVEDDDLVVTLQRADELLERPEADQHGEDESADQ
ncbi:MULTISPECIES: hypothetical protein [unclassified Haloarcula]|uniref:hypothetical protein n=1 Tax=unclassified Haloarcula TaxID=2624677 RepID=UPI0017843995|nr:MULTISPECIES: hypothetical protein [unclassified Haloarcula]